MESNLAGHRHNGGVPQLVECVPNFSEGRDPETLHQIASAIRDVPGILLLGHERDEDHNRAVFTFVGAPDAVVEAAVRAAEVALVRIDLNRHAGVHPRIGAMDVLPFVPVAGITLAECADLARLAAGRIWQRCEIPCYLYEAAALIPERRNLAHIRRGQFEGLKRDVISHPDRRPDVGGPGLHPTAGAIAVGARKFLIAWNVLLRTEDVRVSRDIADIIRQSSGGFPFLKALGLPLPQRALSQVSMNVADFEETPLQPVFDTIVAEAAKRGVEVEGSELIGFVPRKAVDNNFRESLRMLNFRSESILESRLETLLQQRDCFGPSGLAPAQTVDSITLNAARLIGNALHWGMQTLASSSRDDSSLDWHAEHRDFSRLLGRLERIVIREPANLGEAISGETLSAALLQVAEHAVRILTWLASQRGRLESGQATPILLADSLTVRHMLASGLGLAISAGYRLTEDNSPLSHLRKRFAAFEALL